MNPPRQSSDEDEFSGRPLDEIERKKFRRMERDYDQTRWLWRTLRTWGGYFTMFAGIATLISAYLQGFFGSGHK